MKLKRRESRETAFMLVFEWGFREEETLADIILQAEIARGAQVDDFAYQLADKTICNCAELDKVIEGYSQKWKLNRIPRVTLAALRMSFCELSMIPDIPVGATINEAVELVKKFATEEDAAYLNGILGQYERDRVSEKVSEKSAGEKDIKEQISEKITDSLIQESEEAAVQAAIILEEELPAEVE